jgi:hypothetical protein
MGNSYLNYELDLNKVKIFKFKNLGEDNYFIDIYYLQGINFRYGVMSCILCVRLE